MGSIGGGGGGVLSMTMNGRGGGGGGGRTTDDDTGVDLKYKHLYEQSMNPFTVVRRCAVLSVLCLSVY